MTERLHQKTYKLFIGGPFRSESGRTYEAEGQNVARASRKTSVTRCAPPVGVAEVGRHDGLQPGPGSLSPGRD